MIAKLCFKVWKFTFSQSYSFTISQSLILFYTTDIKDNIATLTNEEALHCTRTLRKRIGDTIFMVDGQGGFYQGKILSTHKKVCTIAIEKTLESNQKRPYKIHIAIAPTKNISRFEWFLEKATEIGIDEITPLLCRHSERKKIRLDRLEKILIAAMKQSLKTNLPKINPLTTFSTFLQTKRTESCFIAHCQADNNFHLKEKYQPNQNVLILIGPEGDFSSTEIATAIKQGFQPVTLGQSRLRTETAGIVACHVVALMNS